MIKSVVTGQAPVTLELRNTPEGKTQTTQGGTRIYITADAIYASTRNTYKSEIGSQSTMCQVHTGAYVLLLTPGETDYTACHPRKTTYGVLGP